MIVKMKQVCYREVEMRINDTNVVGVLQRDAAILMSVHDALLKLVASAPMGLKSTGVVLMIDSGGERIEGPMLIEYEGGHAPAGDI